MCSNKTRVSEFFNVLSERFFSGVAWVTVGYLLSAPGTDRNFAAHEVVKCLMPPNHPKFCRPS